MDENKVARFRPVLSGFASRVAGLGIIEICGMCGNRTQGAVLCFNAGEKCARVRSPSQKQSALVSRHRRSDGLDGRGMRRGVTTRVYIFHFRKRLIKYTNGGGSPPGCVSCGVQLRRGRKHAAIGPISLCIFTAVCQCGSHCCYHPVSPVCSAATGRETPALGTHDRLSFARSRPPLALSSRAHGTRSNESSAGPAITSPPCWLASWSLTAPNTRQLTARRAPFAGKLAFSLRDPEKA